jgi:hypothetical protein
MVDEFIHASEWWIQSQNARYGPFDRPTISRFVHEGRIVRETLVCPVGASFWRPAGDIAWLNFALSERELPRIREVHKGRVRYLVWTQVSSAGGDRVEATLRGLGAIAEIDAGFWALQTDLSVTSVRNAVAAVLGKGDRLLVVDATHDRISWLNLGPEADTRLKLLWAGAAKTPAND